MTAEISNASGPGVDRAPSPSARSARDFQLAEEILGELIGWCAQQLRQVGSLPPPGADHLQQWRETMASFAAQRRTLNCTDHTAVRRVIETYGPVVDRVQHGEL